MSTVTLRLTSTHAPPRIFPFSSASLELWMEMPMDAGSHRARHLWGSSLRDGEWRSIRDINWYLQVTFLALGLRLAFLVMVLILVNIILPSHTLQSFLQYNWISSQQKGMEFEKEWMLVIDDLLASKDHIVLVTTVYLWVGLLQLQRACWLWSCQELDIEPVWVVSISACSDLGMALTPWAAVGKSTPLKSKVPSGVQRQIV